MNLWEGWTKGDIKLGCWRDKSHGGMPVPSDPMRTLEEALCRECMAWPKPTCGGKAFSGDFRLLSFVIVVTDKVAVKLFSICWVHGSLDMPGTICIKNQDLCRLIVYCVLELSGSCRYVTRLCVLNWYLAVCISSGVHG